MGCSVCKIDGTDYNTSGLYITSYDLPDCVKSAEGQALDKAGVDNELYDDVSWNVSWVATGNASAQAANINTLTRAMKPGSVLTWMETGMSSSLTTTLRTVECAGVDYRVGFSIAKFTGMREPFWKGRTYTGSASAQPTWVGTGAVNYDGSAATIGGEVSAEPTVRYIVEGATSSIGIGFTPYSASSTSLFSFSGIANSSAEGGEAAFSQVGSTWTANSSAALALVPDAGRKLAFIRCQGESTFKLRLNSRLLGASLSSSASIASDTASITGSGRFEVVAIGPVSVPVTESLTGMAPSIQVMVQSSSGTASGFIDHMALLPLEHAIIVDTTSASSQGIYVTDSVAYLADADGVAPLSQSGVTFYGSWGIPTGQSRFVCVSSPTADKAPPSSGTLELSWTERFIHRASQ